MSEIPNTAARVAFLLDDRLSHDRKGSFARTIALLKAHFVVDILPNATTEDDVVKHLEGNHYNLILIPWFKYISFKKVENYLGSLRLQGSTVAGYFADAVLPMDLSGVPNFNRFLLLDFYRFDHVEIVLMLSLLTQSNNVSGFHGLPTKNVTIYQAKWFDNDYLSTSCVDSIMHTPLIENTSWASRGPHLRFFLTALWTLCFQSRKTFPSTEAVAEVELVEYKKRLMVKIVFGNSELTLRSMMEHLWPNGDNRNISVRQMVQFCDFVRIHHYPETHQIEITAIFSPTAPSLEHPLEVRGFWIEPLKKRMLHENDSDFKRIEIGQGQSHVATEAFQHVIESLRKLVVFTGAPNAEDRTTIESQLNNIRFLLDEVEKRLSERKKIA